MALLQYKAEIAITELFVAPSISQFKRFSVFIDFFIHQIHATDFFICAGLMYFPFAMFLISCSFIVFLLDLKNQCMSCHYLLCFRTLVTRTTSKHLVERYRIGKTGEANGDQTLLSAIKRTLCIQNAQVAVNTAFVSQI